MLPFLVAALVVSAIAAWVDWRTGLIPNWVTLGGVVAGLVGHVVYGWTVTGWQEGLFEGGIALGGLLFCSLAPALMYWKGAMGGGDLKLFAAMGALCQPMLGIEVQLYALLAAALIAPARLAYEGRLLRVLGGSVALVFNPLRRPEKRRAVPAEAMTWFRLGPAVFAGTLVTALIHGYATLPP
jgi:prepilin peptidase CpaA